MPTLGNGDDEMQENAKSRWIRTSIPPTLCTQSGGREGNKPLELPSLYLVWRETRKRRSMHDGDRPPKRCKAKGSLEKLLGGRIE